MKQPILILFTLFLLCCEVYSQDSLFHIEEAFRIEHLQNCTINKILTSDLNRNGIDEIIVDFYHLSEQNMDHHQIAIYENGEQTHIGPLLAGSATALFSADFNSDGLTDIVCESYYRHLYVYYGPDFELSVDESDYFAGDHISGGGDRIYENGESNPVFNVYSTTRTRIPGDNGGDLTWSHGRLWEGTWENGRPREIGGICYPSSFSLGVFDGRSAYFTAGYNRYSFRPEGEDEIDSILFQLYTNFSRDFSEPDSLILYRDLENRHDESVFHQIGFCKKLVVCDFDDDNQLEWLQPYWTLISDDTFQINLPFYNPIDLVLDQSYQDTLYNLDLPGNRPPYPIVGVFPVDINHDSIFEIGLALQGRRIQILNSSTFELLIESDFLLPNVQSTYFEYGRFDRSNTLQIVLRIENDFIVYSLPEEWQEPDEVKPNYDYFPNRIILFPASPNPFNSTTRIAFQLPCPSHVNLSIHDQQGREVTILLNQNLTPGTHEVRWQAENQPSGMYFCLMEANGFRITKGIVFLR